MNDRSFRRYLLLPFLALPLLLSCGDSNPDVTITTDQNRPEGIDTLPAPVDRLDDTGAAATPLPVDTTPAPSTGTGARKDSGVAAGGTTAKEKEKSRSTGTDVRGGESDGAPSAGSRLPVTKECGPMTDEMISHGRVVFTGKGNCTTCHKSDAKGSALGPDLTDHEWIQISGDFSSILENIRTGVPLPIDHPTPMPPMGGGTLTDEELCSVAAYVWSLSH